MEALAFPWKPLLSLYWVENSASGWISFGLVVDVEGKTHHQHPGIHSGFIETMAGFISDQLCSPADRHHLNWVNRSCKGSRTLCSASPIGVLVVQEEVSIYHLQGTTFGSIPQTTNLFKPPIWGILIYIYIYVP